MNDFINLGYLCEEINKLLIFQCRKDKLDIFLKVTKKNKKPILTMEINNEAKYTYEINDLQYINFDSEIEKYYKNFVDMEKVKIIFSKMGFIWEDNKQNKIIIFKKGLLELKVFQKEKENQEKRILIIEFKDGNQLTFEKGEIFKDNIQTDIDEFLLKNYPDLEKKFINDNSHEKEENTDIKETGIDNILNFDENKTMI